jgi:hypothetical protein
MRLESPAGWRWNQWPNRVECALDLGGKKIAKLEGALDEEGQVRASAEREAAELRVQVATLTERTVRMDELQAMIEKLK